MLYTRLNDQGTAFEPQRNLMLRTFGLDGGGTVAADAAGNVYVGLARKKGSGAIGRRSRPSGVAGGITHDSGQGLPAAGGACVE